MKIPVVPAGDPHHGSGVPLTTEGNLATSIIIPTKNRQDDLVETVRTILAQRVLPEELIIVDQTPDDVGRLRVEDLFATSDERVRRGVKLLYLHDPTIPGAAVARNVGMDRATREIFVFLDDDVILDPGFLKELLQVYRSDSAVAGVSGTVTNYSRPGLLSFAFTSVFYRGVFYDERQQIYWNSDALQNSDPIPVRKFGAGGMSIRRDAVGKTRFDPHLNGVPRGEDIDFCARLGATCKLVIAPRSRYVHKSSPINRVRQHWLELEVEAQYYLFFRNWNHGLRASFAWLNVGFCVAVALGAVRSLSSVPLVAAWKGVQAGRRNAVGTH
jgi:GT2 family glycosyltransferase